LRRQPGKLPKARRIGKKWLFPAEEVHANLERSAGDAT
jgi:hypothetical protein